TGVRVVRLFTGSLSAAEGPAPTYLEMMRYNVGAIVAALEP
ncbi:MAG TPA: metal ABC transporter substrate-binding protein, partial [Candidatus Acetothermia bacterium]|nr:metal ABC transporter substrate-binding protein [Candidatus Acetothermia bacterium]